LPVTASLSGSTVNLTAKTTGSATNYPLSSGSSTSQPTLFTHPSFTISVSGATLTGGSDGTPTYDTGTVWITVNGIQTSAPYGQSSTSLTLANALASSINGNSSVPATATVSGSLLVLVAKTKGAGTNYSLSAGSSTSQPGTFTSPSFTTTVSGAALTGGSASATSMYSSTSYAPFGESYAQAGTADLSFIGLNQDTVSGLYDADAREYSVQGRWPSPDPSGISSVHAGDPQTLNRYAYSRNNPLSLADPSGMDWCDWFGGCDGGWGGGGWGCDWDPSCFGGSLPNPFGGLPDPFGLSNYPLPGMGCDWGCLDPNSGDSNGGQGGEGNQSDELLRSNCFDKSLNDRYKKMFPDDTVDFEPDPNVPTHSQGGHLSSEATADGVPTAVAEQIQQDFNDHCHWYQRGTKLPGGAHIPSCHADITPDTENPDSYSSVNTYGHVDNGDVTTGPLGLFRHIGEDLIWGTIIQALHWGDLDKRCDSAL
jgi:RHS repeat-associated protein